MYNKLFTRILDSSIWLEDDKTRIVWITMLASMDEDGMVQMASVSNLARRAAVSLEDARRAISILESPDAESSDPEHDGRRVERVPGGWIVLNAMKYAEQVTRNEIRRRNRDRVARHRKKQSDGITEALQKGECNASVMGRNDSVMQSVSESESLKPLVEETFFDDAEEEISHPEANPKTSKRPEREAVKRVFAYYLQQLNRSEKQYALTKGRMHKGLSALEECKRRCAGDLHKAETTMGLAVDGLLENRFLMGENERRRQYVDWVDHVFKNTETMEKRWADAGGLHV